MIWSIFRDDSGEFIPTTTLQLATVVLSRLVIIHPPRTTTDKLLPLSKLEPTIEVVKHDKDRGFKMIAPKANITHWEPAELFNDPPETGGLAFALVILNVPLENLTVVKKLARSGELLVMLRLAGDLRITV